MWWPFFFPGFALALTVALRSSSSWPVSTRSRIRVCASRRHTGARGARCCSGGRSSDRRHGCSPRARGRLRRLRTARPARTCSGRSLTLGMRRARRSASRASPAAAKATLANAILQILKPPAQLTSGRILFEGSDLAALGTEASPPLSVASCLARLPERDGRSEPGHACRRPVRRHVQSARADQDSRRRSPVRPTCFELVGIDRTRAA